MAYDSKAIDFAYGYYARGWSRAKAVPEIRKVYAGFSGSTWDEWEAKHEWKQRRAMADAKLREFEDSCRDIGRTLLLELDDIRKRIYAEIQAGNADVQTYYAFVSIAKRTHEISAAHFAARDNDRVAVQVLSEAIEYFLLELRSVPGITRALEENAAAVGNAVSAVAEKFGQQ
jgi:hypothetical protein